MSKRRKTARVVPAAWADDFARVLYSEEQLVERVATLANEISASYSSATSPLCVVVVLKGAVMFATELIKNLAVPYTLDFITLSSYGNGTESSGDVRSIDDFARFRDRRDVLIIEDIVDSGNTLSWLKSKFPQNTKIATLFDKPTGRACEVVIDFVGFTSPDVFIVGFGLDYAQKYRGLPFVAELTTAAIESAR